MKLVIPFGVVQVGINAVVIGTIPQVSTVDSSRAGSIRVGIIVLAGGTG